MRKPDERRKRSREAKKARQEAAADAANEEVKRLKNLKRAEIDDKWVVGGVCDQCCCVGDDALLCGPCHRAAACPGAPSRFGEE